MIRICFWAACQTSRPQAARAPTNLPTGLEHGSRGPGVSSQSRLGSPAGGRRLFREQGRGSSVDVSPIENLKGRPRNASGRHPAKAPERHSLVTLRWIQEGYGLAQARVRGGSGFSQ